jgi:hypothetical protein
MINKKLNIGSATKVLLAFDHVLRLLTLSTVSDNNLPVKRSLHLRCCPNTPHRKIPRRGREASLPMSVSGI